MKLTIVMPDVRSCGVSECAYNGGGDCRARAITVGDGVHPACDTFCPSDRHVRSPSQPAGVGACKVSACAHNRNLECEAPAIRVGHHDNHADCTTFARR